MVEQLYSEGRKPYDLHNVIIWYEGICKRRTFADYSTINFDCLVELFEIDGFDFKQKKLNNNSVVQTIIKNEFVTITIYKDKLFVRSRQPGKCYYDDPLMDLIAFIDRMKNVLFKVLDKQYYMGCDISLGTMHIDFPGNDDPAKAKPHFAWKSKVAKLYLEKWKKFTEYERIVRGVNFDKMAKLQVCEHVHIDGSRGGEVEVTDVEIQRDFEKTRQDLGAEEFDDMCGKISSVKAYGRAVRAKEKADENKQKIDGIEKKIEELEERIKINEDGNGDGVGSAVDGELRKISGDIKSLSGEVRSIKAVMDGGVTSQQKIDSLVYIVAKLLGRLEKLEREFEHDS